MFDVCVCMGFFSSFFFHVCVETGFGTDLRKGLCMRREKSLKCVFADLR